MEDLKSFVKENLFYITIEDTNYNTLEERIYTKDHYIQEAIHWKKLYKDNDQTVAVHISKATITISGEVCKDKYLMTI